MKKQKGDGVSRSRNTKLEVVFVDGSTDWRDPLLGMWWNCCCLSSLGKSSFAQAPRWGWFSLRKRMNFKILLTQEDLPPDMTCSLSRLNDLPWTALLRQKFTKFIRPAATLIPSFKNIGEVSAPNVFFGMFRTLFPCPNSLLLGSATNQPPHLPYPTDQLLNQLL